MIDKPVRFQADSPEDRDRRQTEKCLLAVLAHRVLFDARDLDALAELLSKGSERTRLRCAEMLLKTRIDAVRHLDDVGAAKEERLRAIGWTPNGPTTTTNNLLALGDDALRELAAGASLESLLTGTTTGGGPPVRSVDPEVLPDATTGGSRDARPEGVDVVPAAVDRFRLVQPESAIGPDPEPEKGTAAHVEWAARQTWRGHNYIDTRPRCPRCSTALDEAEPHDCPVPD